MLNNLYNTDHDPIEFTLRIDYLIVKEIIDRLGVEDSLLNYLRYVCEPESSSEAIFDVTQAIIEKMKQTPLEATGSSIVFFTFLTQRLPVSKEEAQRLIESKITAVYLCRDSISISTQLDEDEYERLREDRSTCED